MDELILENVRCFRPEQTARLRPLTFLVGENSTGKSTFLAMVRAAAGIRSGTAPDFNEPPFPLGAFDQIAHYHGGRGKRARSFRVGGVFPVPRLRSGAAREESSARVVARFCELSAQPHLADWSVELGEYRVSVSRTDDGRVTLSFRTPSREVEETLPANQDVPGWGLAGVGDVLFRAIRGSRGVRDAAASGPIESIAKEERAVVDELIHMLLFRRPEVPVAIAPIRTRPLRTYDPVRDDPTPEGDHVPMVLSNLAAAGGRQWDELRGAVRAFGKESGLLDDLDVDRKGKKDSDPFQVRVRVGRYPFNLVDVGYGVSQVLPILVDAWRAPGGTTFLLQQPEVHLHPRAQAALGTFLARLTATQKKRFVVETHSDYLIDRVRMEMRESSAVKFPPGSVGLLFFNRVEEHVEIVDVELDESGEIVDPPEGYRRFFLGEQRRLLGV